MDKEAIATKRLFPNEEQRQDGSSNKRRLACYSLLITLHHELFARENISKQNTCFIPDSIHLCQSLKIVNFSPLLILFMLPSIILELQKCPRN